jgi:hypothetical protein
MTHLGLFFPLIFHSSSICVIASYQMQCQTRKYNNKDRSDCSPLEGLRLDFDFALLSASRFLCPFLLFVPLSPLFCGVSKHENVDDVEVCA